MTQETPTKRLWRFEAFTLSAYDLDDNDLSNYITNNTYVWCQHVDCESVKLLDDKDSARWDNAEHWVMECMDARPYGWHSSYKVFPAIFNEITIQDLYWIRVFCHEETIGTEADKNWPPNVFMQRELIAAYNDWVTTQHHPALDFESETTP